MHIARTEPKSVDIASLDESLILKEKDIYEETTYSSGADDIIEKIMTERLKNFMKMFVY